MSCITKGILRWGLIGGLALGGLSLVWPQGVARGVSHVRAKAQQVVDAKSDDPTALRRHLERLADQYPGRIAEIRGELAEVENQMSDFERDVAISRRVVAMTTEDLENLKELVARAEAKTASGDRPVAIRYEGVRFDIDEAYSEGRRINGVRVSYQDRLAHDETQLELLREQRVRLSEILGSLETEFGTYQNQLWQLEREIDAIERNDRLIELTERHQATLRSYERYGKIDNLKQVQAKLSELRERQLATLDVLDNRGVNHNYEERARGELDMGGIETSDPFAEILEIEIPERPLDEEPADRSVVFAD